MKEKNAEISARVDEVICILHTNPNKFANALGYKRAQTVYDILEGKSAPSYDFFNRFALSGYSVFINLRWLLTGNGNPIIEEAYYQSDLPIVKGEMTSDEAQRKLQEIRSKNSGQNSVLKNEDTSSPLIDRLFDSMEAKDATIREQAAEIGRLNERIAQLQREKGKDASVAPTSDIANVG